MYKKLILLILVFTIGLLIADPLFEVKDDLGISIFSVTPTGVKIFGMSMEAEGDNIWISDSFGTPLMTLNGTGMTVNNTLGQQLMIAGTDSVRFYINTLSDESRGGFAIATVANSDEPGPNFLDLTPGNYFIGHEAGVSVTTGLYNQFIGYQSGMNNTTGNYGVFLGYQSGYSNTIGSYNLFQGYKAGYGNTMGYNNTYLGYGSGEFTTTGYDNVFIGNYSGRNSAGGLRNVYIGYQSGSYGQNDYSVFIGAYSGQNSNDIINCTFIGYHSGQDNESGHSNTFIGANAGQNNTTASGNTFIGSNSGYYTTTGIGNTFLGYLSGEENLTGYRNTFSGSWSGEDLQSGYSNCFYGYMSGGRQESGNYNVFIGDHSGEGPSTIIGSSNNNVYVGSFSGGNNTGDGNVFIGDQTGYTLTAETNKLMIDNSNTTSPLIWGDFSNNKLVINGNSSNNYNNRTFFVNGSAGGTSAWYNDSDERLKENISGIDKALYKVCNLQGITFDWKDKENRETDRQIGFIAQDVEKILPEVVANENDHYSMQYAPITALLVEAVKEQQEVIENSENEIQALETRISELESLIKVLINSPGREYE